MGKTKKKIRKPESPTDRLKKVPLWQWGLLLIIAGLLANVAMGLQPVAGDSAAARGQAFGRGIATLLFVVAGFVMIVVHFVRPKRR